MSATISEASQIAPDSTDCRLTVQFPPLLVRGTLTMSNCTFRHSGCRCKALVTRHLISSSVAGVFEFLLISIARPFFDPAPGLLRLNRAGTESWDEMVNAGLTPRDTPR